jgi:hypothetical protein
VLCCLSDDGEDREDGDSVLGDGDDDQADGEGEGDLEHGLVGVGVVYADEEEEEAAISAGYMGELCCS